MNMIWHQHGQFTKPNLLLIPESNGIENRTANLG
jgi:hypothetical protein